MRRIGLLCLTAGGIALASGCNRQDAEALSNIGQILVQKAKSLPVSSDAKMFNPTPSEPDGNKEQREEKDPHP
jgi:hypothetical protein